MVVQKGHRDNKTDLHEALFLVRGTSSINTRAIQIEMQTKSLNSNDSFILLNAKGAYIWQGKGSNQDERDLAAALAVNLFNIENPVRVEENQEPEAFWQLLGGEGTYSNKPHHHQGNISARLFQCSNATGIFKVHEISNFSQDDLDHDDVMILDGAHEVFVWIGYGSNEQEKMMGMETAIKYVDQSPKNRKNCPIYVIQAGNEVPDFTSYFFAWDPIKAKNMADDLYLQKLMEVKNAVGDTCFSISTSDLTKLTQVASEATQAAAA